MTGKGSAVQRTISFATGIHIAALRPVAQRMVHQYQRQHGFSNWCRAYAHARIVTTKGLHHHWLTIAVNRAARRAYAGSRLDRDRYRDVLTR